MRYIYLTLIFACVGIGTQDVDSNDYSFNTCSGVIEESEIITPVISLTIASMDFNAMVEVSWKDGPMDVTWDGELTDAAVMFFTELRKVGYIPDGHIIGPNNVPDALINLLCDSGRVCEVRGHIWGPEETSGTINIPNWYYDGTLITPCIADSYTNGATITTEASDFPEPKTTRTCLVCGKVETKCQVWK